MASASPTSDVVVWEWEERANLWIPYDVATCHFLEKSFLNFAQGTSKKMPTGTSKKMPTINLGKCSSSLSCYDIDLVKMEQQRIGTGKSPASCIFTVTFIYS